MRTGFFQRLQSVVASNKQYSTRTFIIEDTTPGLKTNLAHLCVENKMRALISRETSSDGRKKTRIDAFVRHQVEFERFFVDVKLFCASLFLPEPLAHKFKKKRLCLLCCLENILCVLKDLTSHELYRQEENYKASMSLWKEEDHDSRGIPKLKLKMSNYLLGQGNFMLKKTRAIKMLDTSSAIPGVKFLIYPFVGVLLVKGKYRLVCKQ